MVKTIQSKSSSRGGVAVLLALAGGLCALSPARGAPAGSAEAIGPASNRELSMPAAPGNRAPLHWRLGALKERESRRAVEADGVASEGIMIQRLREGMVARTARPRSRRLRSLPSKDGGAEKRVMRLGQLRSRLDSLKKERRPDGEARILASVHSFASGKSNHRLGEVRLPDVIGPVSTRKRALVLSASARRLRLDGERSFSAEASRKSERVTLAKLMGRGSVQTCKRALAATTRNLGHPSSGEPRRADTGIELSRLKGRLSVRSRQHAVRAAGQSLSSPANQPSPAPSGGGAEGVRLGDLKNALANERATRPVASNLRAGRYRLRCLLPGVAGGKTEKAQMDELLDKAPAVAPQNDVAGVLRDRVQDVVAVAEKSPDLAFSMAVSVCRRWKRAQESEYIFSEMMKVCEKLAGGRDLEVTVTIFRSFAQRLSSREIHRRARLRIGRLYYEHGHFGKAVVELDVDKDIKDPNRYESLACLVKAVSFIRLGRSEEGMSLLKWVASHSPEEQQQARAAYLIGRLNLLYGRDDEAARWLNKCANELTVQRYAVYARRLLRRLNQ